MGSSSRTGEGGRLTSMRVQHLASGTYSPSSPAQTRSGLPMGLLSGGLLRLLTPPPPRPLPRSCLELAGRWERCLGKRPRQQLTHSQRLVLSGLLSPNKTGDRPMLQMDEPTRFAALVCTFAGMDPAPAAFPVSSARVRHVSTTCVGITSE